MPEDKDTIRYGFWSYENILDFSEIKADYRYELLCRIEPALVAMIYRSSGDDLRNHFQLIADRIKGKIQALVRYKRKGIPQAYLSEIPSIVNYTINIVSEGGIIDGNSIVSFFERFYPEEVTERIEQLIGIVFLFAGIVSYDAYKAIKGLFSSIPLSWDSLNERIAIFTNSSKEIIDSYDEQRTSSSIISVNENPIIRENSQNVSDEIATRCMPGLEHTRLRPCVYIGQLGNGSNIDDGIYVLVRKLIDNSIDEYVLGYGNRITIRLVGKLVSVRDYGRGIPLENVVECVAEVSNSAKYSDDVLNFSIGLKGIGYKTVNALSSCFHVKSQSKGRFSEAFFERGILKDRTEGFTDDSTGTLIEFMPDEEIFGQYKFNEEFITRILDNYCNQNKSLSIDFNGKIFKGSQEIHS